MERVGLHRFREGLAEQRLHFVGALEHGVDATALYAAYAAAVVDELPVAFGRSAVCDYDHRFGREFTGFRFLCGARFSGGSPRAGRKYSNKWKKSRIIGSVCPKTPVGLFARACCIGLLRLRRHGGHFDGCGGCGKTRGRPAQRGRGGSEMYGVRNRGRHRQRFVVSRVAPGRRLQNAAEASPRRPHNLTENYGTYLMNRSSRYLGSVHIWSSMISSSLSMWRRISSK